jgi:hypothetical protein
VRPVSEVFVVTSKDLPSLLAHEAFRGVSSFLSHLSHLGSTHEGKIVLVAVRSEELHLVSLGVQSSNLEWHDFNTNHLFDMN